MIQRKELTYDSERDKMNLIDDTKVSLLSNFA